MRTLIEERKKREIDPTLTKLRELEMQAVTQGTDPDVDAHARIRIAELREMIELLTGWYDDMNRLETERLVALLKMGAKLQKFVAATQGLPLGRKPSRESELKR